MKAIRARRFLQHQSILLSRSIIDRTKILGSYLLLGPLWVSSRIYRTLLRRCVATVDNSDFMLPTDSLSTYIEAPEKRGFR